MALGLEGVPLLAVPSETGERWSAGGGQQHNLGGMAGLAPERTAQGTRIGKIGDHPLQRDIVSGVAPVVQVGARSLEQDGDDIVRGRADRLIRPPRPAGGVTGHKRAPRRIDPTAPLPPLSCTRSDQARRHYSSLPFDVGRCSAGQQSQ